MKFFNSIFILSTIATSFVRGDVKYFNKCIKEGDFAITFDDGPSLDYTEKVLDVLDEFGVKATFFVNGKNCVDITTNPTAQELIKREYKSGHIIGSHTFTHPFGITQLTDDQLTYELNALNDALYDLIGVKPTFFRPPLGEYTEDNLKIIEKCGIKANILWNLDSEDWDVNYNATQQYIDNLEGKDPFSHSWIALNHDIQKVTAETNLRIVIPYLRELGYNLVTMDVCTGLSPYQSEEEAKAAPEPAKTTTKSKTTSSAYATNNGITKDPNDGIVIENPQNLNNNSGNNDSNTSTDSTTNTTDTTTNTNDNSSGATTLKNSIVLTSAIILFISYLFI